MRGAKPVTAQSKRLRATSTDAERQLWSRLRSRQVGDAKFVRQFAIGKFIVDFVCREQRLIVEVDGSQHLDSARDKLRDGFLRSRHYRVLRFWNNDVLTNTEGVCEIVRAAIVESPPHPDPLPASGEREKKNE